MRAFPNLYPALARQEVVVHAPRHARSLAELTDDDVALVAEAWQRRAREAGGYVHAFVNEGAEAGSSLPHSHSQLAWLDAPPPAVAAELPHLGDACVLCRGPNEDLVVEERDGVVASVRAAGRGPYEVLIAPRAHAADAWRDERLATALQFAARAIGRVRAPVNVWLHPLGHWHVEVLPRLSALAGLELGAGVYVNTLPPEEAAARLRVVA